jgi:hypothetical protein
VPKELTDASDKSRGLLGIVLQDFPYSRIAIFLVCIFSGGAVLAEVYGVASLHDVFWFAAVPTYIVLPILWAVWRGGRRAEISDAIAIGAVGGFLGTIAYDVARIPFVFAGYRIFAQNASYGLWILDADYSTRFSLVLGWIYHFANGTLFGVMYAVFMRDRHWAWAIAWAFLLETIALVSPYGHIYHITESPFLTVVAYYGHVAYALPLGFMVKNWSATAQKLRNISPVYQIAVPLIVAAAIVGPLIAPDRVRTDAEARKSTFVITGSHLEPSWQRLSGPGPVRLRNSCDGHATILLDAAPVTQIQPCGWGTVMVRTPGIHLITLPAKGFRTHSSFILVEAVSETP